jgi:5-methylcytosine-specific restriction protein A
LDIDIIKSAANTTKDLVNGLLSNLKQRYDYYKVTRGRNEHEWFRVREEFIKENGAYCRVCGKTQKLNVHHIVPFHINPDLELDKNNLIVLCTNRPVNCHYLFGHLLDWKAYNPTCRYDVAIWNQKIRDRKYN